MGSSSSLKLPVLDFSDENLKPRNGCWESTCKKIVQALEEYGCFVAVYKKFPLQLHEAVFISLRDLFELPVEAKSRNVSERPFLGYLGKTPIRPIFESLCIYHATSPQAVQHFSDLMWPNNGNHHFCKTVLECTKQAAELEEIVKRMVFDGYGVTSLYESHHESTTYLLHMNSYSVPQNYESSSGLEIHTDKSFLTVLHENQVNGLEVKTKGGHWIQINSSSPSSFVVMAGDALRAWSNSRIHAPFHRVIMRERMTTRYTIVLFSFQKGMLQVPKELIDEKHPLQFKPFDHIGLLRFYYSGGGRTQESIVKAYCGL